MNGLSFASMIKFAPLMGKRLEDLTVDDVSAVLVELGSPVSINEELLSAGLALMGGQNIHTVADMIKSPESIQTLINFVAKGAGVKLASADDLAIETASAVLIPETAGLITAHPGWRLPGQ